MTAVPTISVVEATKRFKVSESTILRRIKEGKIAPVEKPGVMLPLASVERLWKIRVP